MMDKFFLKDLLEIPAEISFDELNQLFQNLLEQLQIYLDLQHIDLNVKILLNKKDKLIPFENYKDFLDIGVNREYKDILIIEIFNSYQKYFPFILLREAYNFFVPNNLKSNNMVKLLINQIVIKDLESIETSKTWIKAFRNIFIDSEFISGQFDTFDKFINLKGTKQSIEPTIFFFEYIRNNILVIQDKIEGFYDALFREYYFKTSISIYSDEMVELIRVLIKIFYKVKNYNSLEEYKKYFKEFKENGYIQTDLSLRKFISNIKWLSKFSVIGPSYDIDSGMMGINTISCTLRFHPFLERKDIDLIIKNMPFFYQSMSSEKNFSIEIFGWFIIPRVYQKDVNRFLENLHHEGYLVDKYCFIYHSKSNRLNMNYYREFYKLGRIINPDHRQYKNKYNIEFNIDNSHLNQDKPLSILDYLILDRIRNWSITGFSFEQRSNASKLIKSDFLNEGLSQLALNNSIEKIFEKVYNDYELKNWILELIENNTNFGFFYIKELLDSLLYGLKLMEKLLEENPDINNRNAFFEYINIYGISFNIEDNIVFHRREVYKRINKDFLPLYFSNRKKYFKVRERIKITLDLIKVTSEIMIYNLEILKKMIENKHLVEDVITKRDKKIRKIYKREKIKNFGKSDLEHSLTLFSNTKPPFIKPKLISTMNVGFAAKYYLQILLKETPEVLNKIEELKKFFPRLLFSIGENLFGQERLLKVHIRTPNLEINEKKELISILFNEFKDSIINIQRYFYDGLLPSYTRRQFYDFERNQFVYTKDLYEQYIIYIKSITQTKMPLMEKKNNGLCDYFWQLGRSFDFLVKKIEKRNSYEQVEYNIKVLNDLYLLHSELKPILLDRERFKSVKEAPFFKRHVKSIKFKPVYQKFGFGKYYLYIRPTDFQDFDFKLILSNNFQKIRYPSIVENPQSLFITYVYPKKNPNISYLNWLYKSKKKVNEFCLFSINKIYQIFHFNYNLSSRGWILNANRFKSYMQKILFNPNYITQDLNIVEQNIGNFTDSTIYSPDSKEYENLTQVYNWRSIDLKSILSSNKDSKINSIKDLLKKDLIFPYMSLHNLGIREKIYILLPNIKGELIDKIVKIFGFFNLGFIYEIEGSFFIKGMDKDISFEHGLFIKLYFPDIELSNFYRLFDFLFQFLKIKKYIVFNDMVDGKELLKSIFGNLDFLKKYNPLKNLRYDKKDKKYMNDKLYTDKFKPIYPDLI